MTVSYDSQFKYFQFLLMHTSLLVGFPLIKRDGEPTRNRRSPLQLATLKGVQNVSYFIFSKEITKKVPAE